MCVYTFEYPNFLQQAWTNYVKKTKIKKFSSFLEVQY